MTLQPPIIITTSIVEHDDGFHIEARLEDGKLYQDSGAFETFEEAKRAYDDMIEMVSQLDGARIVTTH